jgi:hypothetical protein
MFDDNWDRMRFMLKRSLVYLNQGLYADGTQQEVANLIEEIDEYLKSTRD